LAAVGEASALAPIARVARALEPRTDPPTVVVTIEPSSTYGEPLASVRKKLLEGEIDVALCPASRLPLALPPGLEIGAVLRCRDPLYRFLSHRECDLALLPPAARIVVCDAIARAQILHRFPALRVEMSPPNDTLIAGLAHDVWQAACVPFELVESDPSLLARSTPVPAEEVMPIVGSGLVAVLLRVNEARLRDAVRHLNEAALEHCLRVERAFLARLADIPGCVAAARATQGGGMLELTGLLADESGRWLVVDQARAPGRFAEAVALEIADACRNLAAGHHPKRGTAGKPAPRRNGA
jgi:hydroxymethylbilane synthase